MALTKRFVPHSININTAAGAVQAWINQIKNYAPDEGVQLIEETGGSQIDREFATVRAVEPKMPIVTSDLSFLGTCGFSGIHISPDASNGGLIAYGREQQSGAVPTALATTNHLKCVVTDGDLFPVSIRGAHNQVAIFNLLLLATLGIASQSGAAPMVFSSGVAIPATVNSIAPAGVSNVYTASAVKFNSTLALGIKDLAVDFGIEAKLDSDSGDVYPSMVYVAARNPKIMFTTDDVSLAAAIGEKLATTSFASYFQKCTANAARVSKASAAHIGISGTTGIITPGAVGLAHKTPGSVPFTWTPVLDTVIISVATNATIPTS